MTPNQPIHTLSLQGMAQAPRFDRCCTLSRFPRELDFDCTPGSGKVNPGSAFHRSSFDVCRESYRQLSLGSHNRPMGLKFPVFVKRRDKSGEVVNTICPTGEATRQTLSGIWQSHTRSRRLTPGGLGARHHRASALTGRTESLNRDAWKVNPSRSF